MKAAVLESIGSPLVLRDIPIPEVGPDEVLIKTHSTGICGTDLHIVDGHGYVPRLPHVLGHEPSGTVEKAGTNVSQWKAGDRVVPSLFFTCNRCRYCLAGRHQQCSNLQGLLGVLSPGAMAEFFKVPAQNLFLLPDAISLEMGGLIADAVVTAVHAAARGGAQPGSIAMVLGSGGVGLCLIQALLSSGVRVWAADVRRENLEVARSYGAEKIFLAGSGGEFPRRESCTEPIESVFDCVGSRSSLRQAADLVANCGRVIVVGEQGEQLPLTSTEIAQRELEIVGSRNGTRKDLQNAIDLVARGSIRPLIAGTYPLERVNEALAHMRSGVTGRIVIQVAKN